MDPGGRGCGHLGLLISIYAWLQPATTTGSATTDVNQVMTFAYTAKVEPTPAYQSTRVESPQPVFRKQASVVDFSFAYRGDPGTVAATANLSTGTGWKWSLPMVDAQEAPDGVFTGSAALDLDALERRAIEGTRAAGVGMTDLTITIAPVVTTETGEFRPELPLTLDSQSLSIQGGDPAALEVRQTTQESSNTPTANSITVLGLSIGIWPLRIGGLLLILAGLGAVIWLRTLPALDPAAKAAATRRRYKELIVPVTDVVTPNLPVFDVPDVEALARLAKRYALLIFFWTDGQNDVYFVQDETAMYRCVLPLSPTDQPPTTAAPRST